MRNEQSRRLRRSERVAFILTGLLTLSLLCEAAEAPRSAVAGPAAVRGEAEAVRDIRNGQLILRTFGFSSSGQSPYAQLLEKRLGVMTRSVAGCVVTSAIVAETAAYNAVMKAEIRKRFGADVLERIADEASRESHQGSKPR